MQDYTYQKYFLKINIFYFQILYTKDNKKIQMNHNNFFKKIKFTQHHKKTISIQKWLNKKNKQQKKDIN